MPIACGRNAIGAPLAGTDAVGVESGSLWTPAVSFVATMSVPLIGPLSAICRAVAEIEMVQMDCGGKASAAIVCLRIIVGDSDWTNSDGGCTRVCHCHRLGDSQLSEAER